MNQENKIIAAIDIGTTKIVAIVGKKNKNGRLEILGVGKASSEGVKRGLVQNIEATSNAIMEAVEQAQERSGVTIKEVFVGIAGQHIRSIKNRGYLYIKNAEGEISQQDVDTLTEDMYKIPLDSGDEIIHVIPQSYVVDNESGVKNPVGMFGKRLEANFHIVIGKVSAARNIKRCVNRAGLEVVALMLEPLASAEAVLADDEKEAGVVMIDIGGGTTDMAIYLDGTIKHTAVIPYGGNVITNDIKTGCSILARHAETLKVKYGNALSQTAPENKVVTIPGISGRDPKEISFKTLAYIIQSRMEEIIDAIMFEVENSGIMNKLSAGIAITGGGALLANLDQLMKFHTHMDVRCGLPNRYFSGGVNQEFNHPIYSTAIGLILKGFDYYVNNSKPDEIETNDTDEDVVDDKNTEKTGFVSFKANKSGFFGKLKREIESMFEESKDTKI